MAEKETETYKVAKEKSEAVKKQIEETPEKFRMLTGDRPTGKLHIGHYFGTLKNRVELQNKGVETLILIADYQVITDRENTENIKEYVYSLLTDYIACGIDVNKTSVFVHSQIPELNQLLLPFLSLISESELHRNPTVKAEFQAAKMNALSGLLLTYPVHQAADILFCKSNVVPVGKDQLPHIEMTKLIAKRFNKRYGDVFRIPNALLSESPELLGLDGRKMSKSYNNTIMLSMTEEETRKMIGKALTDSDRNIYYDKENRPGVSSLLELASLTSGQSVDDIAAQIGDKGAGTLKQFVTESVNNYFRPIREKRAEIENDTSYLSSILKEGNERIREIAQKTLKEVSSAMGMNY